MTEPSDSEEVLWALRFGWYLAEARGRLDPAGPRSAPPGSPVPGPSSPPTPLPLRNQLDNATMCTQAVGVVVALATKLDDDKSTALADQAGAIRSATQGWPAVDTMFATLDRQAQDVLTARSDTQACAYLLGRGLAECYWAQDPPVAKTAAATTSAGGATTTSPSAPSADGRTPGWAVLTEDRRDELSRMVGRMAPYFNRYTAPAVAGTLAVWCEVAGDPEWRVGVSRGFWGNRAEPIDIDDELYRQVRRWYELLVLGQDPSSLIRASALLRSPRATWTVVRGLAGPLVAAAAGVVLLAFFATFLSTGDHGEVAKVITGSVGALGVTVASIMAKAKAQALKLLSRTRDDAYTDLVTVQILTVTQPRRHPYSLFRKGDVRNRKLTVGL